MEKETYKNSKNKLIKILCLFFLASFIIFLYSYLGKFTDLGAEELIERYYLDFKYYIDNNYFSFLLIFLITSTIWISITGIATPVLLISSFAFGYIGCILSLFSFLVGSTFIFTLSRRFEPYVLKKLGKKKISNDQVFFYVVLRLIPGIPFIMKNMFGILFNLNIKKFLISVFIADFPQIILFTFFFKRIIETSELLIETQDFSIIFDKMLLPIIFLIIFLLLLFFIKKKSKVKQWIK